MIRLTVYLKKGTMGKSLKCAMMQFTLVKTGIIESSALENQQMAFDTILFFHCLDNHTLGPIYYFRLGFFDSMNMLDPEEVWVLLPTVAAADCGFMGEGHTQQWLICLQFQIFFSSLCKGH